MKPKIFIDGEHGTTGLQIRARLAGRGDVDVISIPADRRKDPAARADFLRAADIAILCLPDDAARESVALIGDAATRVIDASTAHRVAKGWTYGFPEMDREQAKKIAGAKLVANPGCWPQGPIATLRPLVKTGLIPAGFPITMNGISGYSGGGRQMVEDYEAKGDDAPEFLPYGLTFQHKHVPEFRLYAGLSRDPLMQPVVGDFAQGMVTAVPLQLAALNHVPSGAELHAAIADHYAGLEDIRGRGCALRADERTPELNPRNLQRHQPDAAPRLRQRQEGSGPAGRRLRQSRQGRLGRGGPEHGPDARPEAIAPCRLWSGQARATMIQEIVYGSPLYHRSVAFREEQLRRPLGQANSAADLEAEDRQIHIAATDGSDVIGTVVLKPLSPTLVKLRQMAVAPHLRRSGLGGELVRFAERIACERGYETIEMAARIERPGFLRAAWLPRRRRRVCRCHHSAHQDDQEQGCRWRFGHVLTAISVGSG